MINFYVLSILNLDKIIIKIIFKINKNNNSYIYIIFYLFS